MFRWLRWRFNLLETEVAFWKVFASTLGSLIDLSFEQHIVQATWTQHRHTYSTLAQVNLTHLPNDPVALWPAWPFTMSICCMCYLKACSYEYSRVQIIDIHVYERWLFQIPPARFGSSMQCLSQTVGRLFHGSFFERFSLTGTGIVCKYIPWLFSNSACAFVPQKHSICLVLCPLIWIVCIFYLYIEAHNYGMLLRINIPGSCAHLGGSIGVDGTRALFAYATRCPDS